MTLSPIPGHKRPISGGQGEVMPSASPSGARATSGRERMVHHSRRLLGVRPCRQYLDTEGRFRGRSARICRRFLHREQGLHRDGISMVHHYKDFWEYDPAANIWTQKADFGGTEREYAVGFSIGSKGYIGTGYDGHQHVQKTSGSMTLSPIPGHRRPISGGQRELLPSASPSGARAT